MTDYVRWIDPNVVAGGDGSEGDPYETFAEGYADIITIPITSSDEIKFRFKASSTIKACPLPGATYIYSTEMDGLMILEADAGEKNPNAIIDLTNYPYIQGPNASAMLPDTTNPPSGGVTFRDIQFHRPSGLINDRYIFNGTISSSTMQWTIERLHVLFETRGAWFFAQTSGTHFTAIDCAVKETTRNTHPNNTFAHSNGAPQTPRTVTLIHNAIDGFNRAAYGNASDNPYTFIGNCADGADAASMSSIFPAASRIENNSGKGSNWQGSPAGPTIAPTTDWESPSTYDYRPKAGGDHIDGAVKEALVPDTDIIGNARNANGQVTAIGPFAGPDEGAEPGTVVPCISTTQVVQTP